jgi:hypothetical protein
MAHLVEALSDKSLRSPFQLLMLQLQYYIHLIFLPHYGPAIDTVINRNESQVCLLRIKATGA